MDTFGRASIQTPTETLAVLGMYAAAIVWQIPGVGTEDSNGIWMWEWYEVRVNKRTPNLFSHTAS